MDVASGHAQRYMELLRPLLAGDRRFELVLAWDCAYRDDSHEAAWFEAFYRALVERVLGSICGTDAIAFVFEETALPVHFFHVFDRVLLDPQSAWFGEDGHGGAYRAAAEEALPALAKPWGVANSFTMSHPLLDRLPAWLGFSYGPLTLHGGRATVHQGQLSRRDGRVAATGPSYRLVTDLGTDRSHTVLPGGASDRRFSPWYDREVDAWHGGRLKPLAPHAGDAPP